MRVVRRMGIVTRMEAHSAVVLGLPMGPDRAFSRLVDQITGDGWLLSARAQVGQVSYAIEMREVETWHNGARLSASEVTVRLWNHSIDPHCWGDQPITLRLSDDLQFSGVIRDDGTQLYGPLHRQNLRLLRRLLITKMHCPTAVSGAALGFRSHMPTPAAARLRDRRPVGDRPYSKPSGAGVSLRT